MRKGRESKFSHRVPLVSEQKKAVLSLRGVSVFSNKRMRGALPATDPSQCLTAAVDLQGFFLFFVLFRRGRHQLPDRPGTVIGYRVPG